MDRPHSSTETVRFTLAALLVWVSTLPNGPEASSHLLLPYIHFQCASSQPSKQHSSKLSLLLPLQNIVYGKGTDRCQGQPMTDSQQLLLLLPCSLLLCYWQFSLSTAVSFHDCYPSHFYYLHCENLKAGLSFWLFADFQCTQTLQQHEYRSAAKLATWDFLEKELTWHMWKTQVLAEISVVIKNSILAKLPSAMSMSMAWKLQRGFLVFLSLLIFVTPIWYRILHFISPNFVTQAGRKHKQLPVRSAWEIRQRKSTAKPSYGKGNRL